MAVSLERAHCRHQAKFIQGLTRSRDRVPQTRRQVSCRKTQMRKAEPSLAELPDFWSSLASADFLTIQLECMFTLQFGTDSNTD